MNVQTLTLIIAAGCTSSAQANVTFTDGVFAPASWTSNTIADANGVGSTSLETQILTGGNNNEYMRIEINLVAIAAGGGVFSLNRNTNAFYDPSIQGAVTHIDYSEDSRNFQPASGGNVQGTGLLIEQGGKTYIQRSPVLVMPNPGFTDWAQNSAAGLVASDLWEVTATGTLIASSNPDFSTSGAVMQFGFWRGASSGNFVGTDFRDAGIDNWRVVIAPSPASASLLGIGLFLSARRRR